MSATGMGAGQAAQVPPAQPRAEITHIEIRRVQNGFVIAGINMDVMERTHFGANPQRATFIAGNIDDLAKLLEWIVTGSELKWLPTVDLPVWDMHQREQISKNSGEPPRSPPMPEIDWNALRGANNPPTFGHAGLTPNGP